MCSYLISLGLIEFQVQIIWVCLASRPNAFEREYESSSNEHGYDKLSDSTLLDSAMRWA